MRHNMRHTTRHIARMLVIVLLLSLGVAPAFSASADDWSEPAAFYAAETDVFAVARLDEDFITQVNSLLASLPLDLELFGLPTSAEELLYELSPRDSFDDGTYEADFAWVGDWIAVGTSDMTEDFDFDRDTATYYTVDVADRDGALAYVREELETRMIMNGEPVPFIEEEVDGGTLFYLDLAEVDFSTTPRFQNTYFVGDDYFVMRPSRIDPQSLLDLIAVEATLNESEDFTAAIERLPADRYNGVVYWDVAALADSPDLTEAAEALAGSPVDYDYPAIFRALGAQSFGATILNDNSLVIDVAANVADLQTLADQGIMLGGSPTLDLAFADRLPAETPLVLHNTGIGPTVLAVLDALQQVGDFYDEQQAQGELDFNEDGLQFLDAIPVSFEFAFQGLSGADLRESLAWMTGDYALFVDLIANENEGALLPVLPSFGIMIEATDSAAAADYVQSVGQIVYELGFTIERDDQQVVVPFTDAVAQGDDRLDLIATANADVFTAGTRPATAAALSADGGLTTTDSFAQASQLFIDDPQFLAYINLEPLTPLVEQLQSGAFGNDLMIIGMLAPVLETGSVTASYNEDGSGFARFVLTLGTPE